MTVADYVGFLEQAARNQRSAQRFHMVLAVCVLIAGLIKLWPRYVFSYHIATRFLPPKHGDPSGVRGAAWLWESANKINS